MSSSDQSEPEPPPPAAFIFDYQASPEKKHYDFRFALPAPTMPSPQPMDVDTSAGSAILAPPEAVEQTPAATSRKKQKLNDGKVKPKIRKLVSVDPDAGKPGPLQHFLGIRSLFCGSLVILLAVMFTVLIKEDLRKDFYVKYKRQYNLLLYGLEDYCGQELNLANVTRALEARLVGQSAAIGQIVDFFEQHRHNPFSSLVLVGPVGVGKSLMADLIAANFQWRSNVHRYRWFGGLTAEKQFARFQSYLHSLRHGTSAVELNCGHSLFIIDHLEAKDVELVNKIDARLRMVAEKDDLKLTALYLFQGSFAAGVQDIRRLKADIQRVVLRPLDQGDMKECILIEAAELGIDLNENQLLLGQVVSSLDVHRYGCKGVRAKLSLYSQAHSREDEEL
ncbi:uncharacterized protein LOC128733183 [Sabethes cyaneus]|uniref:uncharacterized protein LOC128733183 n=1 Tax=Sabethes cyaneus TaxID=53552 RepID=UPI00237E52E4|nr:uncharacterized protein LOC128733183 [Sabethes cyaneus]